MIAGLIVVLALAWAGYWYAAYRAAETAIGRANSGAVAGHRIGCPGESLGGFPLRLDLSCERLTYSGARETLTAALGALSASAPLYRPGYVAATLTGPLVVNAPDAGVALTAEWSSAAADVFVWIGGLAGAGARFDSLAVENDGDTRGFPVERLEAHVAEAAVAPAGDGSYRLTASADDLDVTPSDAAPLPTIDGEASLVAEDFGTALGTDPLARLLDWLRDGGAVTIERVRLAMAGAEIVAEGSLSLSDEGLLNGSLLLSYSSIESLGDLIETFRPGSRDTFELAVQALNAVSRPVTIDGASFRQTPLTFTDGVIWLAIFPLPVDPIPAVRF